MTGETGARLRNHNLSYLDRFVRLLWIIAIYALVIWYGTVTTAHLNTPPILTKIAVTLIALGITGSIYRILIEVAKETKGAVMVLAEFLNRHLLEPQKRRLIDQGRKEGRAETIVDIRSRLLQEGIDPGRIIPDEESDDIDRS